jgi:hypothetical protein
MVRPRRSASRDRLTAGCRDRGRSTGTVGAFDREAAAFYRCGMILRPWLYALPAVFCLGAAVWLFRENRALEEELAEARRVGAGGAEAVAGAPEKPGAGGTAEAGARPAARGSGLGGLLRGLGRASARQQPSLDPPARESRAERRQRRMEELRAMLGREPGESVADYRSRVVPMITTALAVPRARMEDARREAEKAAGVTDEQRAQIDHLFEDVMRETIDLTNQAIAGGDLTPYERNLSGLLTWGGGLGAILGSTQSRLGTILSAEQRQILGDQGFEWGEYLGTRVPWEQLDPPPPPSGPGSHASSSTP